MGSEQHFPNTIRAVCGVLWRGERFLAVDRPPGKVMAGWWEFPGGKIDPGESAEAALVRELKEELGVVASRPEFFTQTTYSYDHGVVDLTFFHVREFSGTPQALEGQSLAWVTPAEALTYQFLPADVEALAMLAKLCKP